MLNKINSDTVRNIGIFLSGALVVGFWWLGLFSVVFYILGLYAAIYIISIIFKTTGIINFLIAAGTFVLYAISAIVGLYLLYIVLTMMFTGNFWHGLVLLVILSVLRSVLYIIPMAIGAVLGYPLLWMLENIEKMQNKETALIEVVSNEEEF